MGEELLLELLVFVVLLLLIALSGYFTEMIAVRATVARQLTDHSGPLDSV